MAISVCSHDVTGHHERPGETCGLNLGARLEALTCQYGVDIIVSETTSSLLPEYLYRELDRVRVKGKGRSEAIFEPVGLAADVDGATRDDLRRYHQVLAK